MNTCKNNNKFGLFIHWGIYAQLGLQEQALARYDLDKKSYEKLASTFNPELYDPEEWVLMAKKAGMKYICFTAKHHDGFCMWDTAYSDYCITHTPYGKDVLKMLADACEKHGMLLSIYYSNPDWNQKNAYNPLSSHQWKAYTEESDSEKYREFERQQIRELLTGYGPIYTFFWDIPPRIEDRSMNEYIRSLQPDILINNRGYDEGDFATPERSVPDGSRFERMTEACQSVGEQSWGYRKDEDFYSARFLMSSIDKIMAMGGSYLLNVGPTAEGTIDEKSRSLIERVGQWYTRMEGTLENTEPDPYPYRQASGHGQAPNAMIALKKNGKTYLHFWQGLLSGAVSFSDCPGIPKAARLMNNGKPLRIRCEKLPGLFDGETGFAKGPYVSICDIPVDDFAAEPIVIEIEW